MNLIALSALAWQKLSDASMSLICNLSEFNRHNMVTIDYETVKRAQAGDKQHCIQTVTLQDWLRRNTDHYEVDLLALRTSVSQFKSDVPVLLDASGFTYEVVKNSLFEIRRAWFTLPEWHPSFILVCDDSMLLEISESLFDAFYVRPNVLTNPETVRISRAIERRAFLARWFGLRASKLQRGVDRVIDYVERKLTADERKAQSASMKWKHK